MSRPHHLVGVYSGNMPVAIEPSHQAGDIRAMQRDLLKSADALAECAFVTFLDRAEEYALDTEAAARAIGGIGCLIQLAMMCDAEARARGGDA